MIDCPELPEVPLDKCYADASLLSAIITNKYRYHLPLERQLIIGLPEVWIY